MPAAPVIYIGLSNHQGLERLVFGQGFVPGPRRPPRPPPLTKEVFDLGRAHYATIAGRYVGSVGVMDQVSKGLIANPKSTLERELARMVKRSKADDELEIGLLAVQFYLSQLFRDCSTG